MGSRFADSQFGSNESVYASHARKAVRDNYNQLVEDIEAMILSCPSYSHSEAETELENDINTAIQDFHDALDEFRDNEDDHIPEDDFLAAHQDFLSSWLQKVNTEIEIKGCK